MMMMSLQRSLMEDVLLVWDVGLKMAQRLKSPREKRLLDSLNLQNLGAGHQGLALSLSATGPWPQIPSALTVIICLIHLKVVVVNMKTGVRNWCKRVQWSKADLWPTLWLENLLHNPQICHKCQEKTTKFPAQARSVDGQCKMCLEVDLWESILPCHSIGRGRLVEWGELMIRVLMLKLLRKLVKL